VTGDTLDGSAERPSDGPLWQAFAAGVAIYLPMLSYFAAVKIVAGQPAGALYTGFAVFVCILVTLMVAEIPIALTALAGERSQPLLTRMAELVTRYTRPVLLICGVAVGGYLIGKGLLAL
jgi:Sap, sulfolipid-1-addressing protein